MIDKNIFADQSTIQISIMKVDGKKITKSLVEQIPKAFPFDNVYNFIGEKIFGFVKTGKTAESSTKYWGIAQDKGKLVRFSFDRIKNFASIKRDTSLNEFSENAIKRVIGDNAEYYSQKRRDSLFVELIGGVKIEEQLTNEGLEKLLGISGKAISFCEALEERQIYI